MRVGVTATAHKVIHNMLEEVEDVAAERGFTFRGLKKSASDNPESEFDSAHGLIESVADNGALSDPEVALSAGTAWFVGARGDARQGVDVLFVDEAGQVSLADALALAQGRPERGLPRRPPTASASEPRRAPPRLRPIRPGAPPRYEHRPSPPGRGVFLDPHLAELHRRICSFISETMYDGRLEPVDRTPAFQTVEVWARPVGGSGLRMRKIEVPHQRTTRAARETIEETQRIAEEFRQLLRGRWRDAHGAWRKLTLEDILVVAPYNAQVRCLRAHLPDGARVGTVDKFQGQEAPVVFFSMASSSGEDVPRGMDFLFSRNRLNVAVSRARALAVVACSPSLLWTRCSGKRSSRCGS